MEQTGIVAFFDILGYQNIIDNNEIEKVSALISGTLTKLPEMARDSLRKIFKGEHQKIIDDLVLSKIETRLVSDSVLVSLPLPEKPDTRLTALFCGSFLAYVWRLVHQMFKAGLPIRGAVDWGEFFLDGQCFAGKPIINCYRIAQDLELSGAVLTDAACSGIRECTTKAGMTQSQWDSFGVQYLVPLKGGASKRYFLLDWWHWSPDASPEDVRQAVLESFRGHNKDVAQEVVAKLENTELSIRAFIQHHRIRASEQVTGADDASASRRSHR